MAYATYTDVQARMSRTLSSTEQSIVTTLLDDAAIMIDTTGTSASSDVKKVVSCRMVMRAIGDGDSAGVPMGATQGSMSGLGYSQSWSISGGTNGELYIGKTERSLLGVGNNIGSYSPLEDLVATEEE